MKKFLKKTLLFSIVSALVIACFFIIIAFYPNHRPISRTNIKTTTGGYGASLLRYREAKVTKPIDVLFCGSSHCYRGFDTRIFKKAGIITFNMGSSSQSTLNTYFLLKDFVPSMKPNKIVLEVFWGALSSNGVESAIDLISNTELTSNNFKMALETNSLSPIITFANQYTRRLFYPLINESFKPNGIDSYISGGFVQTNKVYNSNINQIFGDRKIKYNDIQLNYLDSIIQYCSLSDIELILVIAPVYKDVKNSYSNYYEKTLEIENLAKNYNLAFIDFNSDKEYDSVNWDNKTDWYDNTHLTQLGVEKFNTYFIKKYTPLLVE